MRVQRRQRRLRAALAAIGLLISSAPGCTRPALPAEVARTSPNIVLILTDDQRYDMLSHMPTLKNRLEGLGLDLRRAFVTNPLCCPSRASILTGAYSHTTGVYANGDSNYGGGYVQFRDSSTIATWLHDAGYRTGLFGKYLNHYHQPARIPPGWSRWVALVGDNSLYYDYKLSVDGEVVHHGAKPRDYLPDVIRRYADDFIRNAPTTAPLFAFVTPPTPHGPTTPPPRYEGMFHHLRLPRPPNFNEADVSDKPAYIRDTPRLTRAQIRGLQRRWRNSAASLLAVDDLVKTIINALRDTGRLSNTLIVLMSDNGIADGEHRWTYKLAPYEDSIRVPMVVRWDGHTAPGSTTGWMASNIDLAPTFAQIAGVPAPGADGVSLVPVLEGSSPVRTSLLLEHMYAHFRHDPPTYCGLRTTHWLFVHYASGEEELYNLVKDPFERFNLRRNARYDHVARQMRAHLRLVCEPLPPGLPPF